MQEMNVVISVNHKWLRYAVVMLNSLIKNHRNVDLHIYVLHRTLSNEDEAVLTQLSGFHVDISFIVVPNDLCPVKEIIEWGIEKGWEPEVFFRLALIELLPKTIERILYLDVDIIVNQSLLELYFCEMGEAKLAVCGEFYSTPPFNDYRDQIFGAYYENGFLYFNSGVMLLNLTQLRKKVSFGYYMEILDQIKEKINYPDQDLLNYCHWNESIFLESRMYNLQAKRAFTDLQWNYDYIKDNIAIVHYTGEKPWKGAGIHYNIEQLWWDYAKDVPFYKELMEEMISGILVDKKVFQYIMEVEKERTQLYHIIDQYNLILHSHGIEI